MDFCTCTSCRKNSVACANGQTLQGLYVDPSTQRRNWAKDSSHQDKSLVNKLFPQLSLKPNEETHTTQSSINNEESNGDSSEIAPRNKEAISSTISCKF
ncbi:hypothetical protein O181_083051 [Austropuccinia psidii MF-1]|uniref:Uncharacterized protein n=1 Tax=Austropuccinia psidii MF-1 TaxID=1389203 RepID=A0A9Q3FTU7_9BASI|nr:hypothetical protein [Austropuccinia psidii MF-1]